MPTMTKAGYVPPKAEPPKEPPKPKKTKKKKKKAKMNAAAAVSVAIFLLAVLIAAATIYIYTQTQAYIHAFLPGTMLAGYPLGGASYADGEALLEKMKQEKVDVWTLQIDCMAGSHTITAQDIGLDIDREATLEPLWAAGRDGGMVARYLEILRLWREPLNVQPVLTYDLSPVDALLAQIREDVERGSVDAAVSFVPGSAAPFRFTEEAAGYALDLSGVLAGIEQDVRSLTSAAVVLTPQEIEPAVYRAELENQISVRARLTAALEADEASGRNAAIAAAMFNGVTVAPGETLSFNGIVGRRTAEGGYVSAPEPAYGENVSGVGGGVCQVSTALYRAALLAGLEIAERSAAVRPVAYCGMGQEATVSDQGLDLKVRNQTDAPLFIMTRTYAEDGVSYLEITLFGAPSDMRCELESVVTETGLIEEPVYIRDHDGAYAVYDDERVPVGEAQMGYAVQVMRIARDENGEEISREVISEETYEAIPPTIYVGMQKREE